jgi:hypothetical protein
MLIYVCTKVHPLTPPADKVITPADMVILRRISIASLHSVVGRPGYSWREGRNRSSNRMNLSTVEIDSICLQTTSLDGSCYFLHMMYSTRRALTHAARILISVFRLHAAAARAVI